MEGNQHQEQYGFPLLMSLPRSGTLKNSLKKGSLTNTNTVGYLLKKSRFAKQMILYFIRIEIF